MTALAMPETRGDELNTAMTVPAWMFVCGVRYGLGRSSYVVEDVTALLERDWHSVPVGARHIIQTDIENHLRRPASASEDCRAWRRALEFMRRPVAVAALETVRFDVFSKMPLVSKNDYLKLHPMQRSKLTKGWAWELMALLGSDGWRFSGGRVVGGAVAGKQRLEITRVLGRGMRLWDDGNMQGGSAIALQDSLKHLGLVVDDSPKWLETDWRQDESNRGHSGTRVRLIVNGA